MDQPNSNSGLQRWWLVRGESVIAPIGIGVAGLVLSMVIMLTWWSYWTQVNQLECARIDRVKSVSDLLAQSTEAMLSTSRLTSVRRLVVDAAQRNEWRRCRIILSDGQIIADSNPTGITAITLPTEWPDNDASPSSLSLFREDDVLSVRHPLLVAGRPVGILEVLATVTPKPNSRWSLFSGAGVIGVVSLIILLVMYRRMRLRMMGLGVIEELLHARNRGEVATEALVVPERLGVVARVWNRMILERQEQQQRQFDHHIDQVLDAPHGQKDNLQIAFDAIRHGVLEIDDKYSLRYLNGAAAVFLGIKRDQVIGLPIQKTFVDSRIVDVICNAVDGTGLSGNTIEIKQVGEHGNGVLRFSTRSFWRSDLARGVVMTIEDVTQQRVAEDSRHSFIAQATHELRTPLTNIRLNLETALEEGELEPVLRGQCLNVINQETTRLERLIGDMLSVTEIEAGSLNINRGDVRLDALFEKLENDFKANARDKQMALTFNLPPKLPVIQGDRDKLLLVFHNLLGNAIKYTPAGGSVVIDVEADPIQLVVEIKDTGIGIAQKDMKNIFEKFYRANDKRVADVTGSGLGLALTRAVVRLHGGQIKVDSHIDQGSVFTLTLPIVLQAA